MNAREADAFERFSKQSGVDVSALTRDDLIPLVQLWARSTVYAKTERTLTGMIADAPERFEPGSVRIAVFLMTSILACLAVIGVGVWRFFA